MNSSSDLWEKLLQLASSADGNLTFPSISIDPNGRTFLCKGLNGAPFFLIRISRSTERPTFKLKHVLVSFDTRYLVDTPQFAGNDIFVRISCEDRSEELRKIFVYSVSAVLKSQSSRDPLELVNFLVELFRQRSVGHTKSLIGLWGELLYISASKDIGSAILAWHSVPNQLRDFVYRDLAIEVKTTTASERLHNFRLEQVSAAGENDLLCSILLERSDLGESVFELAQRIDTRCPDEVRAIFWEKLLPEIENFDNSLEDVRFNYQNARESIRFFRLRRLARPVIESTGDGEIKRINFELLINSSVSEIDHLF